jgi:hypothetical protein
MLDPTFRIQLGVRRLDASPHAVDVPEFLGFLPRPAHRHPYRFACLELPSFDRALPFLGAGSEPVGRVGLEVREG